MSMSDFFHSLSTKIFPCSTDKQVFEKSARIMLNINQSVEVKENIRKRNNKDIEKTISTHITIIKYFINTIIKLVGGKWVQNNKTFSDCNKEANNCDIISDKLSDDSKQILKDMYIISLYWANKNKEKPLFSNIATLLTDNDIEKLLNDIDNLKIYSNKLHCRILQSPFFHKCSKINTIYKEYLNIESCDNTIKLNISEYYYL